MTLVVRSDRGTCDHQSEMVTVSCRSDGAPGWISTDVGEPAFPGCASPGSADDCLEICAAGTGISGTDDQFHFVYKEASGDVILKAQVSELASPAQSASVGLMLRESLEPGARHAAILVEGAATRRFRFRSRVVEDDGTGRDSGDRTELPAAWVRIRRAGQVLIGESSLDGEDWTTEIGRVKMPVDFPEVVLAGVAAAGMDRLPDAPYTPVTATVCHIRGGPEPPVFRRGDCNDDGNVDISDAVFTLGSLFLGDGDPGCDDASDANDVGAVDISDAIATLGVLFLGQGTIPLPGMDDCGMDPTEDELSCGTPQNNCPQ